MEGFGVSRDRRRGKWLAQVMADGRNQYLGAFDREDDAAAAVADVPQFEYLATPIRRRKAFANAAGAGLSVLELKPADKKAIDELNALISALF